MLADEVTSSFVHRVDIQPRGHAMGRSREKRIRNIALEERVDVETGARAEASVPVVGRNRTTRRGNRGTAQAIQGVPHPGRVGIVGSARTTHHLSEGMHAGIGAPRYVGLGRETEDALQCLLDVALYRAQLGLTGETVKGKAVVSEIDP